MSKISDWLKNKKVTTRRKIFLVLGEDNLRLRELSQVIHFEEKHVWKTLKKMQIDGYVKQNPDRSWYLTSKGLTMLEKYQKHGSIPRKSTILTIFIMFGELL